MFRKPSISTWVYVELLSGVVVLAAEITTQPAAVTSRPAVVPKTLSSHVERGLAFLAEHQLEVGAWGQGEESAHMGGGGVIKDVPNVADTCLAVLAFLRAGNTPAAGEYQDNVRRAIDFVCREVMQSEEGTLFITTNRNTRTQSKLGPYVDTFMAALLLTEIKDKVPAGAQHELVEKALARVMKKIEANQKQDGTWDNRGWAPVLSQALATKALNRASQKGYAVNEQVRQRAEQYARAQVRPADRSASSSSPSKVGFSMGGAAGVELYAAANTVGSLNDSDATNDMRRAVVLEQLNRATTQPQREQAQRELERMDAIKKDLAGAKSALVDRLEDKQFISGFGSNGGEEFVSYMNIGESLVASGGPEWEKWDKSITENMNRIQNKDGSWSGHHCITGRTFCTSAALMVLMVDRTPSPTASKITQQRLSAK